MKQRISVEQLRELTPEQMERLREWWKDEDGDAIYDEEQGECFIGERLLNDEFALRLTDTLPLLNIGQMIELLQERTRVFNMTRWKDPGDTDKWRIFLGSIPSKFESQELCDALWEAVKAVL